MQLLSPRPRRAPRSVLNPHFLTCFLLPLPFLSKKASFFHPLLLLKPTATFISADLPSLFTVFLDPFGIFLIQLYKATLCNAIILISLLVFHMNKSLFVPFSKTLNVLKTNLLFEANLITISLRLQTDNKSSSPFSLFLSLSFTALFSPSCSPWDLFTTRSSLLFTASSLCHTGLPKTPLFTQLGETNHRFFLTVPCARSDCRNWQKIVKSKKKKEAFGEEDVFLFEALLLPAPSFYSRRVTNQCSGRNCHSAAQ